MKILHLISDHQVVERTLGVYEIVFPGCNDVLVFQNGKEPFKRLKGNYEGKIVNKDNLKTIAKGYDYTNVTHVIAHYMTKEKIDFVYYIPQSIPVCWEIYGADMYNQFLAPMGYELQYTDARQYESFRIKMMRKTGLLALVDSLFYGNSFGIRIIRERYFKRLIERIDSIAVCCTGDAKVLELYSGKKLKVFKAFNYSLKETLGDLINQPFFESNDILVGNSASLTNNHLYILKYIKGIGLSNSKIIIPLSYGGTIKYKEDVQNQFSKVFPGQVKYLMDYMPLYEYNKIFLQVGVMILSSWRQESIGTIFMGLFLGIKIYMSGRSPLYSSLKEEGFIINEIEKATKEDFLNPLSMEQKEHNRNLLLKDYDEKEFECELKRQFR